MNQTKLFAIAILLFVASICNAQQSKPNFVFFLVDDLGWADLGCYGSKFHESPNIDKLSASGMKFTHGYAACPVCSPTRASILTGRHPVRVDITDWIPGMTHDRAKNPIFKQIQDRDNLALKEITIAEVLKENGYATFFAGKWHLGDKGHYPTDQGFDVNIGGNHKGSPPGGYYSPWKNPALKSKQKDEYLTERLTEESVNFIRRHREKTNPSPFFLYLSYYNVHTPITPYKKRFREFRRKTVANFKGETPSKKEHDGTTRLRQDNAAYASMIAAVDESVGAVLKTLKETGVEKNTVVIFFSDNGGLSTLRNRMGPTSNLPLRAGKGWLYEGGVREPMIIRAPGVTKPGSVCETPVVSMDFFPTMLDLAGIEKKPELHADGKTLLPLLKQEESKEYSARTFYWHYPHYHGSSWKPGASILHGDFKLIKFYHHSKIELYNLKDDPGEQSDLSKSLPNKANELHNALLDWQEKMNAKIPEKAK